MKAFSRKHMVRGILFASAILLVGRAFAANKASFELLHPTQVAGQRLAPGVYSVQWDGSGDQLHLNISQGKKQVVSAGGRMVQVDVPSEYDNAIVNKNDDGSMSLKEIRFRGKKYAIRVNDEGGAASGAAGAAR